MEAVWMLLPCFSHRSCSARMITTVSALEFVGSISTVHHAAVAVGCCSLQAAVAQKLQLKVRIKSARAHFAPIYVPRAQPLIFR